MPFEIVKGNIVKMDVDAIVNAANTYLLMGGGVCGAIFREAGIDELQEACKRLAPIETGKAVITPGFNLKAKYIIHTAGPIFNARNPEVCSFLLRSSYIESLTLAIEAGCKSIAFPLISSGIYGYPKYAALREATNAIRDFLKDYDILVYLVIYDRDSFSPSEELLKKVDEYVNTYYEKDSKVLYQKLDVTLGNTPKTNDFDTMLNKLNTSFSSMLFSLIKKKEMDEKDVYKKANIDRKLFSKIRTQKNYTPSKKTIVALSIALELSLSETNDLLEKAGYTLSHSQKFDVIVEYFIINHKYDIFEINEVLFKYEQPILGSF